MVVARFLGGSFDGATFALQTDPAPPGIEVESVWTRAKPGGRLEARVTNCYRLMRQPGTGLSTPYQYDGTRERGSGEWAEPDNIQWFEWSPGVVWSIMHCADGSTVRAVGWRADRLVMVYDTTG